MHVVLTTHAHAHCACMFHTHIGAKNMHMCACTTAKPFLFHLAGCFVMRNRWVIVNYCFSFCEHTCTVCMHIGAKPPVCAHAQLQYLLFATLGTVLHWKIAELLSFEVVVKFLTNEHQTNEELYLVIIDSWKMPFLDVLWLLGHGDKVKHDSEVCHLAVMVIRVPKMCCNELPHLK